MIEFIIAGIIIFGTIIFFLFRNKPEKEEKKKVKESKEEIKEIEKEIKKPEEKPSEDISQYLIKSIRDVKELKRCYIFNNGHIILFCDNKKVGFCYLKHLNEKNTKILSKTIELDTITDISFSEEKKIIIVSTKNTKNILYYGFNFENGKNKIIKLEKTVSTERQFEINNVIISKDGNYISTSGNAEDTEIQIYNSNSNKMIEKISTGSIRNKEMKMSPDDNYILISTFMNEISVIHFEKNDKFNNTTLQYEKIVKINRKKSISGIKNPILAYEFSNDNRFFIISTEGKNIKIYQNYGEISESKVFQNFNIDFDCKVISLYIKSFFNGKIEGFFSVSKSNDIYVYDTNGNLIKNLKNASDDEIIKLKFVKVDLSKNEDNNLSEDIRNIDFNDKNDENGKIVLISASLDGRIKIWDLNLN